jgi:hypothetical protein
MREVSSFDASPHGPDTKKRVAALRRGDPTLRAIQPMTCGARERLPKSHISQHLTSAPFTLKVFALALLVRCVFVPIVIACVCEFALTDCCRACS